MDKGRVIRGYSSFYYVEVNKTIIECRLRGKLRLKYDSILVGDEVTLTAKNSKGVIQDIMPRRTELVRPPIANVEMALVVFSLTRPEPVLELLDRIIISVEHAGIEPVLVFTKADLLDSVPLDIVKTYQDIGYQVIANSADGEGLPAIRDNLVGRVSVVAGPSGAGKSTLLNALQPGLALKTGEVSDKIGRGKHTTRHVELLPLVEGGYVADTPGFSVLYLPDMKPIELPQYYNEFMSYQHNCRFKGCLHKTEPDCAVKLALQEGKIDTGRYERYLIFLDQLFEKERNLYD